MDPITKILCDELISREERGLKKYGVTVSGNNLTTEQWLQHAIEEALDLAVYLARIKAIQEAKSDQPGDL
ncbi:MAG: hypothetical protein AB7V18_19545 [Pyrinomonadaceae bacterium]